jgi:hypothetical protein
MEVLTTVAGERYHSTLISGVGMPMVEKHGGIWDDLADDGWRHIYERYDAATDRIGAVFGKGSLFKAVTFEKVSDPQWKLPFWSERKPEAIFGQPGEAISYVELLISASP